VLEYPELGMEAIWRIEVEDFPAFIVVDDKGNDFFGPQLGPPCGARVHPQEPSEPAGPPQPQQQCTHDDPPAAATSHPGRLHIGAAGHSQTTARQTAWAATRSVPRSIHRRSPATGDTVGREPENGC
jgi:hypothetical protein